MLINDAVNSAVTNNAEIPAVDATLLLKLPRGTLVLFAKAVIWQMFEWEKDASFKGHIGPIPYSIKVAKIRPLLVRWIGEPAVG